MELTVRENIIIYGRYFGLSRSDLGKRADELIDFVQLNERADDKVEPLSGFAFAGLGVAATTFMRTWQDFELVALVQLPMFLFSATFFPITTYPHAIQWVVRFSPLYHAIQLLRALNLGTVGWAQLLNVGYLLVLGACGLFLAQRRIGKLLLK